MGQPSDLLASAPVGLRGALRDGLRLRTTVVVAHSSEISSSAGVLECIHQSCLPDARGCRSSNHQRSRVSGSATRRKRWTPIASTASAVLTGLCGAGLPPSRGMQRAPLYPRCDRADLQDRAPAGERAVPMHHTDKRNRKFADSLLEGNGFELPVRERCKRGLRRKSPASAECRRRSSAAAVGSH
jgi:hypothetical protein